MTRVNVVVVKYLSQGISNTAAMEGNQATEGNQVTEADIHRAIIHLGLGAMVVQATWQNLEGGVEALTQVELCLKGVPQEAGVNNQGVIMVGNKTGGKDLCKAGRVPCEAGDNSKTGDRALCEEEGNKIGVQALLVVIHQVVQGVVAVL